MKAEEQRKILDLLDGERQTVIYPGVTRFSDPGIIRDVSTDEDSCEIVYSSCSKDEVDRIIEHQIQTARIAQYALEWKVYGHDLPPCLGERLMASGFVADAKEAFMVLFADKDALDRFGVCSSDIRRVRGKDGLGDVQRIMEEVDGMRCEGQIEQYGFMLEKHPHNMSVYVAYIDDEPAAYGRIYFHAKSRFAALYGGQTREQFRNRGLYTQIVATRIREALNRGVVNICVDALPTSEPILRKYGFEVVTYTQPFCLPKMPSSA